MATMSEGYRNAIANHGASLITHIGLVDENGVEISGGDPAYARKEVTWTTAPESGTGMIRPNADLVFDIPEGTTVAGWRGFDQLEEGTNYGGADLPHETFSGQGEYTFIASQAGINHRLPG